MSWQPIDFQGIVSLDRPLVDILNHHLEDMESQLAHTLIEAIPPSIIKNENSPLQISPSALLRLSDAIEAFTRYSYQLDGQHHVHVNIDEWNHAVKSINKALWSYVETIDSCIIELFQQLELIGLEQWHVRLSSVVGAIKDLLVHRIDDLIWGIKRLETFLRKARFACENPNSLKSKFLKNLPVWNSVLDRSLIPHLEKNQDSLKTQYQKFIRRYQGFLSLQEETDKSLDKLTGYHILESLDQDVQVQFIKLYQLLKLLSLNKTEKALPSRDFVLAVRNAISVDKAISIFKEYYNALHENLFIKSLFIKQHHDLTEEENKNLIQEIQELLAETHLLGTTIAHYREFLLQADPDPYVRTRLGFSDWIVGPEPIQTKPLLNMGYDVESLNELYEKLCQSLEKNQSSVDLSQIDQKIQYSLHEMSHPLASYRLMRGQAENVLEKLQQIDELCAKEGNVIDYFDQIFARLLRLDWKYQVLFGFPLFHQMFAIHQGLLNPIDDRHHQIRLTKFKKLLQQILEWVKSQKTQKHTHDLELDINDIKGYLQDFLGYIQRHLNAEDLTQDSAHQFRRVMLHELLEYRYLFGNFFYRLRQNETEGPLIRRQFLFVDQYFETIELKLDEVLNRSWPEQVEDQTPPEIEEDND